MNHIKNLNQIRNTDCKVYVRWSKSFKLDQKRGYSLRCGSSRESGLSCCEIDPTWEDWRIIRQLREYIFCGGSCWIITGDEVGIGGDNEPLLANIELVGKVSNEIINTNWKKMELESKIAKDEERLSRITDEFGKEIVEKALAKNRALLEKMTK